MDPTNNNMSDLYVKRKLELREEHIPFDVESWFPLIEDLTFPTKFIAITPDHAEAMRAFYSARYTNRRHEFTLQHVSLIKEIMVSLDKILTESDGFKQQGAFVRFSSRSPKDGQPFQLVEFEDIFQNAMIEIIQDDKSYVSYEGDADANRKMRGYCLASSQVWRVKNANEAMNLILSSMFYI
jgi:hypothetical protein